MISDAQRIIVTVIGEDKVGIIAGVSTVLAEVDANIIDISQTTLHGFFAMIMLVDIQRAREPFDSIRRRLHEQGEKMDLRVDAQHQDVFKYMHRI